MGINVTVNLGPVVIDPPPEDGFGLNFGATFGG